MTKEEILRLNNPWPLIDILKKLTEAAEILLHNKNYDGHGWELISHCKDEADELILEIESDKITNNGWIKIESEEQYDELENGEYEWFNINTGKYDKGDLWTYGVFTHYKTVPITKSQPPIY